MLDNLGKVYDRMILNRLEEEYESSGGMSPMQFGFRKGRSTLHAIKCVQDRVETALRMGRHPGGFCVIIALDVKNAFNTASWERVYKSLVGRVPPYLLAVVSDGLRDRVLVCDTDEGRFELELSAGIAQGSVSGPFEWNSQYDEFLEINLPDGAEIVGFADDAALVIVAETAWQVESIGNESLYRIGQWFSENQLELAEHKCEGMLVTKRRSFEQIVFAINGHEIPFKRELKYLGVWFDDRWSYKTQVREAALKADRVGGALQRLMPNIGGPKPNRRALLSTVSYSIMLYGAAIWGKIARGPVIDAKLGPVQRRIALRTISAYCTVSDQAACVLADMPPICLLVSERVRIWERQESLKNDGVNVNPTRKALIRDTAREATVAEWQQKWESSTKGRWTHRLIPNIARWIDRSHGEMDYWLTQALSGHGCFGVYLERFQKRENPVCQMCDADWDDAEHALFKCGDTDEERANLMDWLGFQLTPENLVPTMLRNTETWVKIADFIKTAITRKEERERALQRQARGAAE